MSDEMKVGNPNEVVNNYDGILQANRGALDGAVKDINNGKAPSGGGAGGGEVNLLAEMGLAKSGAVGFAAQLYGEMQNTGPRTVDSAFFGGGAKRPGSKKAAAEARDVQMALTNYNPVSGKLGREENLALWKKVRRSRTYITRQDIMANPAKYGIGEIKKNIDAAEYGKDHRTTHEVVAGTEKGFQDSRELIKSQNTDQVLDATEKMTQEKRENVVKQVLPAPQARAVLQPPAPSWARPPGGQGDADTRN